VFLAETLGGMFFTLIVLVGKFEIGCGRDRFAVVVVMILGWRGLQSSIENISGGTMNPGIALAQIVW
jgi:glycerol uptake facilitator-like aquaporin